MKSPMNKRMSYLFRVFAHCIPPGNHVQYGLSGLYHVFYSQAAMPTVVTACKGVRVLKNAAIQVQTRQW